MNKRFHGFLIGISVLPALLVMPAMGDELSYVAFVGDNQFESLDVAIAAVEKGGELEGQSITVTDSVAQGAGKSVKENSILVIDFGNNTYTAYKNSLVFHPVDYTLLPLKMEETEMSAYPPIMEPNQEALVNVLVPIYLKNSVYAKFLESEVCEQAARSNAMENATKNAEELLEDLQIEFNKARQGAITQEITEIVGASQS